MPLETLVLNPAEPVAGAVVWMHGLGASCSDFVSLLPWVKRPGLRFVFPQAPERPVTVNGGAVMPAWYDILTLGNHPDREDLEQVERSAADLGDLLDGLIAEGIPAERITLAGFSQGAAMALWVGHRYPQPLRSILVMSGYLLAPGRHGTDGHEANADTPTFHMHGTRDEVVPVGRGKAAYDALDDGREARWATYPMGHELCGQQAHHLKAWFEASYPG